MESAVFGSTTFCVVTGASQGIGRTIALHLAPKFGNNSVLILTARNEKNLQETKDLVAASAPGVQVKCVIGDLSDQASLVKLSEEIFNQPDPSKFQHALLIQNAGSLGDVSYIRDLNNVSDIQSFMLLNISSAFILSSKFLNVFKNSDKIRRTVVNVSSLAALQAIKSWSLYCTTKAAREMTFKVLAKEEPDVRVLNYSPGPVGTAMNVKCTEDSADEETRKMMMDARDKNAVLTTDQTCEVLMSVLEKDEYTSGDHVDYFDVKK